MNERFRPHRLPLPGLTPLARIPLPAARIHAMPVEETDLGLAAQGYGRLLVSLAGGRAAGGL